MTQPGEGHLTGAMAFCKGDSQPLPTCRDLTLFPSSDPLLHPPLPKAHGEPEGRGPPLLMADRSGERPKGIQLLNNSAHAVLRYPPRDEGKRGQLGPADGLTQWYKQDNLVPWEILRTGAHSLPFSI